MKTLTFAGAHYDAVMSGLKTNTIREYDRDKHDFDDKDVVRAIFLAHDGEPERTATLRITCGGTHVYRARNLPIRECQKDGYRNVQDTIAGMAQYYKNFTESTLAAVINFELATDAVVTPKERGNSQGKTRLMRGYHLDFCDRGIWLVRESDQARVVLLSDDLVRVQRGRYNRDRDAFTLMLDEMLNSYVDAA